MGWGFVISTSDLHVEQFDHTTGASVRKLGSGNSSFSPYFVTNFDPITGLPLAFAIGADEFANPVSITSDSESVYVLDAIACRVTRWDAAVGDHVGTFGGKRGVGAGRISPDASRRSIISLANDRIWVTDNDNGSGGSGTGWVVAWSRTGAFLQEISIAALITALNPTAVFDQITGWTWDAARGVYWALAEGATNSYLVSVRANGTVTGHVINLTTRLTGSIGVTVAGHGGTPAGRLLTRGLRYENGYLYLWSGLNVIRVDLTGTSGDRLLHTAISNVAPGNLTGDGLELAFSATGEANGANCLYVLTLATLQTAQTTRSYALTDTTPDGGVGDVSNPWDMTVAPGAEPTAVRTSRLLGMKARIDATIPHLLSMRASIKARVSRTLSMRARLLRGAQRSLSMRARIEEPSTVADAVIESWSLQDEMTAFSRGLTLQTTSLDGIAVADLLTVYAGYDGDRVKLCRMLVDEISESIEPQSDVFSVQCRDQGSKEVDSTLMSRTWSLSPPDSRLTAHQIIGDVLAGARVQTGVLEFPGYDLYGTYSVSGQTPLSILQSLLEPFNQFASRQYITQMRDGRLNVIAVDWTAPPANGVTIPRSQIEQMTRSHRDYLDGPRLTGFDEFMVFGTTYTIAIQDLNLGPQTRIEYFRDSQSSGLTDTTSGDKRQWIVTETVNQEVTCGDKVLNRIQEVYTSAFGGAHGISTGTALTARTTEEWTYFVPSGRSIGFTTEAFGPCPPGDAVVLQHTAIQEGIENNVFQELRRNQTNYYYDSNNNLTVEVQIEREKVNGIWTLTSLNHRFNSRTTSGTVNATLLSFDIDDGVPAFSGLDSQHVGGQRPGASNEHARVATFQAMAPQIEVGIISDPVSGTSRRLNYPNFERPLWTYENSLIGQAMCDAIRALAIREQFLQLGGYRWEPVELTTVLNPNLHVGTGVRIEIAAGIFKNYWLESLTHEFTHDSARTRIRARRLTTDSF